MSLDDIVKQKGMTPAQLQRAETKRLKAVKHAAMEAEHAAKRAEKKRIREEAHKKYLAASKLNIAQSIEKLNREVTLKFGVDSALATLEKSMGKYGRMQSFKKAGADSIVVRYANRSSAVKALKAKQLFVKIPVPVSPSEIKHHAVYFDAPEEMGLIDDEILNQIKVAMGGHGTVVMCKKKGRSIVIFFADKGTRDGLISPESANEVTIEIGDHAVKLHAGVPPNARKRRNAAKQAKIAARKEHAKAQEQAKKDQELAQATGQPYKRAKN